MTGYCVKTPAGRLGRRMEVEDDGAAREVREPGVLAILIWEGERGGLGGGSSMDETPAATPRVLPRPLTGVGSGRSGMLKA